MNSYENFWIVWSLFKDKIIDLCKDGDEYWYIDKIIKSYLFAEIFWTENITEWHTLRNKDKKFLKIYQKELVTALQLFMRFQNY